MPARPHPLKDKPAPDSEMAAADMANVLRHVVGDRTTCLTHVSLSWHGEFWPFRHPLDYVGSDGGGGVGGGPGISVGAALALKGSGRLPIAVCGDGDFMMGNTAVWTAAHYRIPILFVVANNRSFYNDEVHQERVAVARNRPVDNKWIGQRIADPDIDMATVARGQGAKGFGPCRDRRRAGEGAQGGDRGGRRRRRRRGRRPHPRRLQPGNRRGDGPRQGRSRHLTQPVGRIEHRRCLPPIPSWSSRTSSSVSRRRTVFSPPSTTCRSPSRRASSSSVIGPSGCGKSTLFNVIGGLLDGYDGRVSGRRRDRARAASPRSA